MKICGDLYWYSLRKPIQTFFGRGATCNVFAIDQGDEIWLIDVGTVRIGRYQRLLKNMLRDGLDPKKIKKIFITHGHADHTTALPRFQKDFNPEILIHEADGPLLAGGDDFFWQFEFEAAGDFSNQLFPLSKRLLVAGWHYSLGYTQPIANFHTFSDGAIFKGNRYSIQCVHTPGHTPGHCSYYIPELKALYCGDLMDPYFDHKPPVNLPSSDFDAFQQSIEKVGTLEVEVFCPAHAAIIYQGIDVYKEIWQGTLRQLEFGKNKTIELLKANPGMQIKDFMGKFPSRIWQFQEQTTLPFAVIKSLKKENKIHQDGLNFYYID
jgi:glyoxylase-like metal-dependent hydrolase (beta-lactamase superfamily II)